MFVLFVFEYCGYVCVLRCCVAIVVLLMSCCLFFVCFVVVLVVVAPCFLCLFVLLFLCS